MAFNFETGVQLFCTELVSSDLENKIFFLDDYVYFFQI